MQNLPEKPFTRRSLVLPIYLPACLLSFGGGILIPTLPLYAKSFDLSLSLIGLVIAAKDIGILITDVPAGILLERIGRKLSMLIGALVVTLSTLGMGLASSFFELILYQFIGGVGTALWTIARHTYITDVVPVPERGRSIALFGGVNRIGTFLGPAVGGYLGVRYSLRAPFFLCAVIMGINLFLCFLFIVETKRPATIGQHKLPLKQFAAVLKTHHRALTTAGLGQVCVQTLRAGRRIIIPLYGSEVLGLNVQAVGVIFSISSAIDMSMFPVAGFIMDRFGRRYATIPCFFIFATGMVMVSFTRDFTSLLIATVVMGFGNGLGSGTMMTLGADLAPKDGTGEFLGAWRLVGDTGHATGPLICGNIADVWGLSFSAAALAGIGYVAVAIFLWLVPETLQKPK